MSLGVHFSRSVLGSLRRITALVLAVLFLSLSVAPSRAAAFAIGCDDVIDESVDPLPTSGGCDDENPFDTPDERMKKLIPRTWSDQTGKFKVDATLLKQEGDKVTLKRKDGKEVTLPLDKLSKADQEFLKGNPENKPVEKEGPKEPDNFPTSDADSSGAPPINVSRGSTWAYTPDVVRKNEEVISRVSLGPKGFFDKATQLFYSPEKKQAIVVWTVDKKARVQLCDLQHGKLVASGEFVPEQTPIAVSPNLEKVVAYRAEDKDRYLAYLYDIKDQKPVPRFSWKPHGNDDHHKVASAHFVDNDHLLTVSSDQSYVLWKVADKIEPVYQISKGSGRKPAFSANLKYFAIEVDGGIVMIETLTGKNVGFLPSDHRGSLLAISPAGTQLASASGGRFRIWDLTKQEPTDDFDCPHWGHEQLIWADEQTLLIDGRSVIDVPHRVQTWSYTETAIGIPVGDRYLCVENDKNCVLGCAQIPNDEARNLVKSSKPDDLVLFKPGDNVSLEVQLSGFPQHQEKVSESLKKMLETNGMKITPGSKLKLIATVKPGEKRDITYRKFMRGFGTEKYTVNVQLASVTFELDGKRIWGNEVEMIPHHVSMKRDETMDAAINRHVSDSVLRMGSTNVPRSLSVLPDGKTAGKSKAP